MLGIAIFLCGYPAKGAELSDYEKTCLDLGFKERTQSYSACVKKLGLRLHVQPNNIQRLRSEAQETQVIEVVREQLRLATERGLERVEIVTNTG